MKLIHDEKAHTYHVDGQRMISVTDVLSMRGFSDLSRVNPDNLQFSQEIGNGVAEATRLLDRKQSWKQFDALSAYVRAWQQFKKDMRFRPTVIEEPFYDPEFGFCSRPDRAGMSRIGWITVQIKTCPIYDCVALQTAAEERIIVINSNEITRRPFTYHIDSMQSSTNRFGVFLKPDGTYKARRFDHAGSENDLRVFLAALTVCKWLENH